MPSLVFRRNGGIVDFGKYHVHSSFTVPLVTSVVVSRYFASTGVQRAMMEAMQRALEVPHMTFCDEVHADRLGQLRSDLKEAAERRGVRLSYLPLIVKVGSSTEMTLRAALLRCQCRGKGTFPACSGFGWRPLRSILVQGRFLGVFDGTSSRRLVRAWRVA